MATDGKRVFTHIINNERAEFKLLPSTEVVRRGGWVAMDAATGQILWSTANPDNFTTNPPVSSRQLALLSLPTTVSYDHTVPV